MTCPSCLAYEKAERAAIAGDEMPGHDLTGCTCAADEPLHILALPPSRIFEGDDIAVFRGRQIGIPCRMRWDELAAYLSRSVPGDPLRYPDPEVAKRANGGWVGGLYKENHRAVAALIETRTMSIDIDAHGEIERAAEALARFRKVIHSTYKSTADAARCRVVLQLSEPCTDHKAYANAHRAMREHLIAWGYVAPDRDRGIKGDIDAGASDCARLNYAPMHAPQRTPRFLATDGETLDIKRIVGRPRPQVVPFTPTSETTRDSYRRGALTKASNAVAQSLEGDRHAILFREAAALSRAELGLSDSEIYGALLPGFVHAAGEARAREGERTIADAISRGRVG